MFFDAGDAAHELESVPPRQSVCMEENRNAVPKKRASNAGRPFGVFFR